MIKKLDFLTAGPQGQWWLCFTISVCLSGKNFTKASLTPIRILSSHLSCHDSVLRQVWLPSESSSLIGAAAAASSHWSEMSKRLKLDEGYLTKRKVKVGSVVCGPWVCLLHHLAVKFPALFMLWVRLCLPHTNRSAFNILTHIYRPKYSFTWTWKREIWSYSWYLSLLGTGHCPVGSGVAFINAPWTGDFSTVVACSYTSQ